MPLTGPPPPYFISLSCFAGFIKLFCPVTLLTKTSFAIRVNKLHVGTQPSPPPTTGDTKSFGICLLLQLCAAQRAAAQPLCTPHRGRVYILLGTHEVPGSNLNPDRQTYRVCVVSLSPSTVALPIRFPPRR